MAGPGSAGVVLLGGAGPSVGYRGPHGVFKLAVKGVPVVALHRNTRYQTADGPALDMGAFVVGLEAAASIEIPFVGKPAPYFSDAALADLGADPAHAVMVGDDIGIRRPRRPSGRDHRRPGEDRQVLPSDLGGVGPAPDHIIDDVGQLPGLLRRLSDGHAL